MLTNRAKNQNGSAISCFKPYNTDIRTQQHAKSAYN